MSEKTRKKIQVAVLAAGILMLSVGILRGEVGTLFIKSTNICLECIGIG